MHHLSPLFRRKGHVTVRSEGCQGLVRFFALLRIKPHAPPLVRVPVNSFEFHSCERNASPAGLRILSSSSTCVGLRYGYGKNYSGFSWQSLRMLPTSFGLRVKSLFPQTVFPACLKLPCTGFFIPGSSFLPASPQFCLTVVLEYQPVVHRLRLSASP